MESLCYQASATVTKRIDEVGTSWLSEIKATPAAKIQSRKGEVMQVQNAVQYLVKHKCMTPGTSLQTGVSAIVKANAWDEKK